MSDYLPHEAPDAATIGSGSDSYAATVISDDGKFVTVRYDEDLVVKGSTIDGSAEYEYRAWEAGPTLTFKRKNGKFVNVQKNSETGRWNEQSYYRLFIGRRRRYYDPHF